MVVAQFRPTSKLFRARSSLGLGRRYYCIICESLYLYRSFNAELATRIFSIILSDFLWVAYSDHASI